MTTECNRCKTKSYKFYDIEIRGEKKERMFYPLICKSCIEIIRQGIEQGFIAR